MRTINLLLLLFAINFCFAQNFPFPQQKINNNAIKPNHKSDIELSLAVTKIYDDWKKDFLKPTELKGGFFVEGGCTGCQVASKGTSEGHGYGMIMTALMAGYDQNAKSYFDGFYHFFNNYRSTTNNELMNWNIAADERKAWTGSATDGDMDIAYALLLAHYQWGSDGDINYKQEAIDMITQGLKAGDMSTESKRVMLGDWDSDKNTTRSSDWMTGHFRAYYDATQDDFWLDAADTVYSIIDNITSNYSINTGLLPDFIVESTPVPASANFLEGPNDGNYYYNACRFPWRIATDYLHFNTVESKQSLDSLLAWANNKINNNYSNYTAGFELNGEPLNTYTDLSFTSPIVLAFCTDTNYQNTLNLGWDFIENTYYSYFDASINVLCQLLITGNWWAPVDSTIANPVPEVFFDTPTANNEININETVNFSFSGKDIDKVETITLYKDGIKITTLDQVPFTYERTFTKAENTTIKALIETTDGDFCIRSTIINVKGSSSVNTKELSCKVYPNPSKDIVFIDCNEKPLGVEIFNPLGQKAAISYEFENNKIIVNSKQVNKGLNYIIVNFKSSKEFVAFVKQ